MGSVSSFFWGVASLSKYYKKIYKASINKFLKNTQHLKYMNNKMSKSGKAKISITKKCHP